MFSDFLLEVITSASVSILLTSAMIWLFKSAISERLKNAIKSEYDQKLETHKAQLKAESDVAIENLKSRLNITAAERHVKFEKLHDKRAEVIAETYARLRDLYEKVREYIKPFEPVGERPREERSKDIVISLNALRDYYLKKQIFLPANTAQKVKSIDESLIKASNDFAFGVDMDKSRNNFNKWVEVVEKVHTEIYSALNELEDEFRVLLGDES